MYSNEQEGAQARRRWAPRATRVVVQFAAVSLSLAAGVAHAGLGDVRAKATTDRPALAAEAMTTSAMPSYDRTEMTTVDGTTVREYSARDGTVFAVDFAGPTMPDLKAVLGPHYETYVAAARSRRNSHHVVSLVADDAVITIIKLPRGFSGHAHVPAAVPAGVDVGALR